MTDLRPWQLTELGSSIGWDDARIQVSRSSQSADEQVSAALLSGAHNVVVAYGADNTGLTETSAAIQAAIDDVEAAGGGTVYLPKGVYLISTTLVINSNTVLVGDSRGHEGDTEGGSLLQWNGAINGNILRINNGSASNAVHGWIVSRVGFDADNITGVTGCIVGAGDDGVGPRAAVGSMSQCWFTQCDGSGLELRSAQLCSFRDLHFAACGYGMFFAPGPPASSGYANTACLVDGCRWARCTTGCRFQQGRGITFRMCTGELNNEHGFHGIVTADEDSCYDVTLDSCWFEANTQDGGPDLGDVHLEATQSGRAVGPVYILRTHHGTSEPDNYNYVFEGAIATLEWPYMVPLSQPGGVLVKATNSGTTNKIHYRGNKNPPDYFEYRAGAGTSAAILEYVDLTAAVPEPSTWLMENYSPKRVGWQNGDKFIITDKAGDEDSQWKRLRVGFAHYQSGTEEEVCLLQGDSFSGSNYVNIGGGTGLLNAATRIRLYIGANSTTTTGTPMLEVGNDYVEVNAGELRLDTGTEITGDFFEARSTYCNVNNGLKLDSSVGRFYRGTAAPTSGPYNKGDIVFNDTPSVGQPWAWFCTTGGTPGTWTASANL